MWYLGCCTDLVLNTVGYYNPPQTEGSRISTMMDMRNMTTLLRHVRQFIKATHLCLACKTKIEVMERRKKSRNEVVAK